MRSDVMHRRPDQSYELFFGPDIPRIVQQVHDRLMESKAAP
jgi:hypothetical protein